jgi:hypothetical protein
MKILYIDLVSGISGDMVISALLDAGCPFHLLEEALREFPVELPTISAEKRRRGAIEGTYLRIGESHLHLSVKQMRELISVLRLEERVKQDARGILEVIVSAESKVHGVAKEDVHLHELSHIDTLIDVVCVARAVSYFKIEKVLCSAVPQGRGFINTAHGIMPNPPPATVEILHGFQAVFLDEEVELTTPTGAAILKYYVKEKGQSRIPFVILGHGSGFGTKEMETRPNIVRVFVGETQEGLINEEIWVIEADMDDVEIEYLGAIADRLRAAGAHDVLYFPVHMKKGRSGIRLSITSPASGLVKLSDMVFNETSTFGMRLRSEFRTVLTRTEELMETSFGPVKVKKGYSRDGKRVKTHVEYEEVKKIADERQMPYRVLLEALKKEL